MIMGNGQEKMQVFSYAIFIMLSKRLFCWRKGKNYSDISAYITMKILAGKECAGRAVKLDELLNMLSWERAFSLISKIIFGFPLPTLCVF